MKGILVLPISSNSRALTTHERKPSANNMIIMNPIMNLTMKKYK